jgi:hypothetical protein
MSTLLTEQEMLFNSFEPNQKNRFMLYIDGIPSFMVKKAARPKVSSEKVVIPFMNTERKVKGKTTWGDMQITLHDPIVPSGQQAVMEWIRLSHESVTGRDGYADFYKKDLILNKIGPVGDKVSEWLIKGAWIMEADFGENDYSTAAEADEIALTLSVDYCVLNY